MSAATARLKHALTARTARRDGVPETAQVPRPALAWFGVALGLPIGGALDGQARVGLAVVLLAVAATRPVRGVCVEGGSAFWAAVHSRRRQLVWGIIAAALLAGGWRAGQLDERATPVSAEKLVAAPVTLLEPLPAAAPGGRGPSALGRHRGRLVQLTVARFGGGAPVLPRGAVASVSGRIVPLGDRPSDRRLRRLGVAGRVQATTTTWDGQLRRGGLLGAIDRFADRAQRQLTEALGARRGALVAGMALGASDGIDEVDADALRSSGLWHLVAASGGNIALVVALVMALGWVAGTRDGTRLALAAVAICLYVPLAGAGPSIQRAGVMGLAGLLALALGREHRGATALALAAAATLALDPRAWLDVGWQLSFAAAAGLIAVGPWAAHRISAWGVPRWLAAGLACTLVATVATAPIMLTTFGELSLIGLIANAIVLPLVGLIVWSGTLAAVLASVAPPAAAVIAAPAGVAAGLTLSVAAWASARTHAVVTPPEVGAIVVALALLAVVRPPAVVTAGLGAVALAVLVWAVPGAPHQPRLVIFDIGQGSAALLQDGAEGVLIDAGPVDGGLVRKLRKTGVRRLRAVLLSHPAADHDGGGAAVLANFPTDLVLDGGDPGGGPTHDAAVRAARRRGVRVVPVRAGQRIAFGRVALRLRWPTPAAAQRPGDPNDRAAVVEARVGELTALIPADAEGNVLQNIPNLLPADVFIASHHGSTDEALPTVLGRVRPKVAVISVGAHNTYGHPTAQALGSFRAARTPVLRTDQTGTLDLRAGEAGGVSVRRER